MTEVVPTLNTGQASPCGQTDTEGNNAFFNCLAANSITAVQFNPNGNSGNISPNAIQGKYAQYSAAAQSVPNNTLTPVVFTTGNFPNPDYFVAQGSTGIRAVKAGLVVVFASFSFVANATGVQRIGELLSNGGILTLVNGSPLNVSFPATGNTGYLVNMSPGDVLSISVLQDSGAALSTNTVNIVCAYLGNLL